MRVFRPLLRLLSHPVLSAAGNVYTLFTLIPGAASLLSAAAAPLTATQWLILSAVLAVVTILIARSRFGHVSIESELTAIIDQGKQLDRGPFFDLHYGSYRFWADKTAAFLFAAFGAETRDRFEEAGGLRERLTWLRKCRERPPRVRGDLKQATIERRKVSPAERVVLAGGPLDV